MTRGCALNHKAVLDGALAQIPQEHIESIQVLVRSDSAGVTHELADYCREHRMRYSVGYELTEAVRAAILEIPEDSWAPALDADGSERENGQVAEIIGGVDLASWPEGSRLIVRRERPHPGAAALLHRPRRPPLPADPHRPRREGHRPHRVPPPPTRPRRGPHPRRQGHRAIEVPLQKSSR
ncbi:MAG TPA: transposase [Solirubrobacteraceae bacterium]|nr:transposase [Solirubrobacteraceae bacterium]